MTKKDGNRIEGFFLREYANKLVFQDMKGKKHIVLSSNIKKLEIGLSGVPACYIEKGDGPDEKECGILLVKIDGEKASFAEGEGFHELDTVSLASLSKIELLYKDYPFNRFPLIKKGLQIKTRVKTRRGSFEGSLRNVNQGYISLKGKRGGLRRYGAAEVEKISFSFQEEELALSEKAKKAKEEKVPEKDEKPSEASKGSSKTLRWLPYAVPGLVQYKQGQTWKGISMMAGSSLFLTVSILEYLKAQAAGDKAKEAELASQIEEQEKIFDTHAKRHAYAGYALLGIYAWHIVDLLYFSNEKARAASGNGRRYHDKSFVSIFPVFQENSRNPGLGFHLGTSF